MIDASHGEVVRVPFNNLTLQWNSVKEGARKDIETLFTTSAFCLGPEVESFEREIGEWLGGAHAIAVSSGTAALHLAMAAAGIQAGDDVLVPAHTFIATAWAPIYLGARPVLCDVDPDSGLIDLADAARRLTPRTRAIVPVHLYGQSVDMNAVMTFAAAHGLHVIEDAAQSVGATWKGRKTGTIGHFGCFSFYPGKNLGAAGEGGLVVARDNATAERIKALRNHGQRERYVHDVVGYNYRMDSLQAIVLRHKLRLLNSWTVERQRLAKTYLAELAGLPLLLPTVASEDHVWHLFVVRHADRDSLRDKLAKVGIETGLHYPVPLHRQPCLARFADDAESYPQADNWSRTCLSLPLFAGMTEKQQSRVNAAVRSFFG